MILMIDNYDSFTFNLVQALEVAGAEVKVIRNDAIDRAGLEALADDPAAKLRGIVVSPGPSDPDKAGISIEAVRFAVERRIPLLGVCLGMQSMAVAVSATVGRAPTILHGESSQIRHDGQGLLAGMPNPFTAARYHSLSVVQESLPPSVIVTCRSEGDDVVMGIRHTEAPDGPRLLANFLRLAGEGEAGVLDATAGSFALSGLAEETAGKADEQGMEAAAGRVEVLR
jgi:anthranilate synthase/aminodeoxychorismate synthase-like glutamine amidotransferase